MKMVIIGYSGAGKSTLAKKLADFYKLPLLHLDKLRFLSNWQARSKADITADIQAFLDTHDSWVMEEIYPHVSLKNDSMPPIRLSSYIYHVSPVSSVLTNAIDSIVGIHVIAWQRVALSVLILTLSNGF